MAFVLPFFFAFAVYGVASPYLAVLIRDLGYGSTLIGLLLGLFEVAGIAGPFLLGRFSDRRGRYRPALALAFMLILVALPPLVTLRHPLLSALFLVVMAIGLRSIVPLLDAAATLGLGSTGTYGRVRSIGSFSFVLMALLLQVTPVFRPDRAVHIALWYGATALAALASLGLLPEGGPRSDPAVRRYPGDKKPRNLWTPAFIAGLVMIGFGRLAMAPITSFFSLYVVEELRLDAVGLMWALAAGSEIPVIFFSGTLIRRYGPPRLLAVSVLAVAVRLGVYALFPSLSGAVVGQLLHSLCYGLFHPAAVAFVTTHVAPENRAVGMTMYLSFGIGLPTFLGSTAGGLVLELAGYRVLFGVYITFALISFLLYLALRRKLEAPVRV